MKAPRKEEYLNSPITHLHADRRQQLRFPIALKLRYSLRSGGQGEGQITNISSAGVLFRSAEPFATDSLIDIAVAWPYQLNGYCPLQLCVRGRVIRSDDFGTAIVIEKYEFRTAGKR